jgi:hypothetical protein
MMSRKAVVGKSPKNPACAAYSKLSLFLYMQPNKKGEARGKKVSRSEYESKPLPTFFFSS